MVLGVIQQNKYCSKISMGTAVSSKCMRSSGDSIQNGNSHRAISLVLYEKLGNRVMHTIDELARISGMPSRTIRFYNTQGMLPPPTMRGRVANYGEEHLLVLNIIKELKEQQNLPRLWT